MDIARIDLHCHTTASDGSLEPRELIKLAKREGLKAIAITDHDTTQGIEEALNEGKEQGVEVIAGIELSSYYNGDVHILGYGIDYKNESLSKELLLVQGVRDKRNKEIVKRFNELGIGISLPEIKLESKGLSITRPHIAKALIRHGYAKDYKEVFKEYLSEGGKCFVKKEDMSPKEAIKLIMNYGGHAVLAHPIYVKQRLGEEGFKEFLKGLKGAGLKGLEVYHPEHKEREVKEFLSMAAENGLCVTGGSDFHGDIKPDIKLGSGRNGRYKIPYKYLEKLFSIEGESFR